MRQAGASMPNNEYRIYMQRRIPVSMSTNAAKVRNQSSDIGSAAVVGVKCVELERIEG